MLDDLRQAQADGDADRFRRTAHSLKSNSNTFGAMTLGAIAKKLELDGLASVRAAGGAPLDALAAEYARVAQPFRSSDVREAGTGGARLLVVDDNKVNRLLLTRNLELHGPPRRHRRERPRWRSKCCGASRST